MGLAFFTGHKVPQNYSEAAKWYRKAAKQGHREAQLFLARPTRQGQALTGERCPRHR